MPDRLHSRYRCLLQHDLADQHAPRAAFWFAPRQIPAGGVEPFDQGFGVDGHQLSLSARENPEPKGEYVAKFPLFPVDKREYVAKFPKNGLWITGDGCWVVDNWERGECEERRVELARGRTSVLPWCAEQPMFSGCVVRLAK